MVSSETTISQVSWRREGTRFPEKKPDSFQPPLTLGGATCRRKIATSLALARTGPRDGAGRLDVCIHLRSDWRIAG
ncbi:GSCOCG00002925001-RA-CDS, partial [Cotesia congregata]